VQLVEGVDALDAQLHEVIELAGDQLHFQAAGEAGDGFFEGREGVGGGAVQHHTDDDQPVVAQRSRVHQRHRLADQARLP
jgi:hypothetical protein